MNLVEVFVEENCTACEAVLEILEQSSAELPFAKNIFHRAKDQEEFQSRGVTILPASSLGQFIAAAA